MVQECIVVLNNDAVTVVKFDDKYIQLPAIKRYARTLLVKYKWGKYSVVEDGSETGGSSGTGDDSGSGTGDDGESGGNSDTGDNSGDSSGGGSNSGSSSNQEDDDFAYAMRLYEGRNGKFLTVNDIASDDDITEIIDEEGNDE